jgi:hypothetical protein
MYGRGHASGAMEIVGWNAAMNQHLQEIVGDLASAAPAASPADLANAIRAVLATPAVGQAMGPLVQPSYGGGGGGLAYGSQPQVVNRPLRDMREYPLGFLQAGIGVGVTAEVISRPQVTFRGERLVIPTSVAANFALNDIKVGNRSQLVNSTSLPAEMFQENAIGIRLAMDTATVAQDIALSVTNSDPAYSHTFRCAIVGTVAQ